MRLLILLFFALVFVIALVFSLRNFQLVEIDLIAFSVSLPLAVALTIELIAGIFLGVFATLYHTRMKQILRKTSATKK